MSDRPDSTLIVRLVQRDLFRIYQELELTTWRLARLQEEIPLPDNASAIWNGEAPQTLETEVYGAVEIIQKEYLPEITGMLFVAAHAKRDHK